MLFISPKKLFLFSRYLNFVLTFWSFGKTAWSKDKVNFRIYDVTTWLTNNCNTHTDQRSNSNQGMAFDQLIEHNMKHFFFWKIIYTKCDGVIISRPFFKKSKLSIFWINILKFPTTCFLRYAKLRTIKTYWN